MAKDSDQLTTRWTSWAGIFAEDLGPPIFTDQPPEPAPRSSAARIAKETQARERAAATAQQMAQLATVAAEDQQERELSRAIELIQRGRRVPDTTRSSAMAALERRGSGLTSAEQMARRHLRAQGWARGEGRS